MNFFNKKKSGVGGSPSPRNSPEQKECRGSRSVHEDVGGGTSEGTSSISDINVELTGGQVDEIVRNLVNVAADPILLVRQSICNTLHRIGYHKPMLVSSLCVDWIKRNRRGSKDHKVILFEILNHILEERREEISIESANSYIDVAILEMTFDRDVIPDLQSAASQTLVQLSFKLPEIIMDKLLQLFDPGKLPHYFVMKTLGEVVSANPVDTVPRLKEVFSRMIPVLAAIKHDNMKWVFSDSTSLFAEAIQNYVANIEKGKDKSLSLTSFSSELFPAYEILATKWLNSNERKLKIASIVAIGNVTAVFRVDQYNVHAGKIIPLIIGMMKKEKDAVLVTQALGTVLETGIQHGTPVIEPIIVQILGSIHPMLCTQPDMTNSASLKNYNELLRCFEILARGYPESVLSYVLGKLEGRDSASLYGALIIMKHLVISIDDHLLDKKGLIVSGISPLVRSTDTSVTVRKAIAQLIVCMSSHDYLGLEGGEVCIEFIVRCCSYSPKNSRTPPNEGLIELREICDNIIHLATTTIPSMEKVVWPYLLELLGPAQYIEATGIICRCLAYLGNKKRSDPACDDYYIDFDRLVNLPKPHIILARLFVLLSFPKRRLNLGSNVLGALKAIGPIIQSSVSDMWDEKLPKMIGFLEAEMDNAAWNPNSWDDLVLGLLSTTIQLVNDEEWTIELCQGYAIHLPHYKDDPELRRVAMTHMGAVVQKISHKEFIRSTLHNMFLCTNHQNQEEKTGCAVGFGHAAATHLDLVLEQVGLLLKQQGEASKGKPSKSFFSFGKDKAMQIGPPVHTLLLCYGYITAFAPANLVTSRIDIHIINAMKPYVSQAHDIHTKEVVVESFRLISRALQPDKLQFEYVFKQRDEVLRLLTELSKGKEANEITDKIRLSCLKAAKLLFLLQPQVPEKLEQETVSHLTRMFAIVDDKSTSDIPLAISEFLDSLIIMNPKISTLCRILQYLEPFIVSGSNDIRIMACETCFHILRKFADTIAKGSSNEDKKFCQLGQAISLFIPRCTDPNSDIRILGIECIAFMLFIDSILRKKRENVDDGSAATPGLDLKSFDQFKDEIKSDDFAVQFSILNDVCGILCKLLKQKEISGLLINCISGTLDSQPTSASGTCVVLNGIIQLRGHLFEADIPLLVENILSVLPDIKTDRTVTGTLRALRGLASHFVIPVLKVLLDQTLPHSNTVVKSLQAISKDPKLAVDILSHLSHVLNSERLYEEKTEKKKVILMPFLTPMAVTAALGEILACEEIKDTILEHYPLVFGTLLLRIGTCADVRALNVSQTKDVKSPKPVSVLPTDQVSEAVLNFARCTQDAQLIDFIETNPLWEKIKGSNFSDAVTCIASIAYSSHPNQMEGIFKFLLPFIRGNYSQQRTISSCSLAEMVNHCLGWSDLLENVLNGLVSSLVDPTVKLFVLRGLGNIKSCGEEQVNKYASTVIDALTASIEDVQESVAMEAMLGLSKVFEIVEESKVSPILVNLCHRIRPAFEKQNENIRAASFTLFGGLYRFGRSSVAAQLFYEQILNNLTSILLHLNDECIQVSQASDFALKKLGSLLRCNELEELFDRRLVDESRLVVNYEAFLQEVSKILMNDFLERMNNFVMANVDCYRSSWSKIRSNAVFFTGTLLAAVPVEKRQETNINSALVTHAMIGLLKEKSPEVRKSTADAMRLLYTY